MWADERAAAIKLHSIPTHTLEHLVLGFRLGVLYSVSLHFPFIIIHTLKAKLVNVVVHSAICQLQSGPLCVGSITGLHSTSYLSSTLSATLENTAGECSLRSPRDSGR